MKIFVDTEVLIDLSDPHSHNGELVDIEDNMNDFNFWISAASISSIIDRYSSLQNSEKIRSCLNYINEKFSIIPMRYSTFTEVLEKNEEDFEIQIQIASAEAFQMDYIVTYNIERYKRTYIQIVTPEMFIKKIRTGYFSTISNVPFIDLKIQQHQVYNEIDDRITDIITNNSFILGKHVNEFEERFAELQEAKYCIGVSSGTDALHIALMALNIGPGDAIIVPVNTFIATAEAVSLIGAVPIFVDCDKYFNIDVQKTREILKQRSDVTGIIPVHLYGQPANMDEIMELADEYKLWVVEDCCQAHLAKWNGISVGNFGKFGAFSFYPGKNLGAYGEAGALITNNKDLYLKSKMIRQHGEIERYNHKVIGHNYRMEAIQGAVLSTKVKYLKEWTKKRRDNAQLYSELLSGVDGIQTPLERDGTSCVYHLYVIQTENRDGLQEYLQKNGISTGLHYPIPLHLQEAYRKLKYRPGDLSVAEQSAGRILSLPMYPELNEKQIRYVCDKIKEYLG